MTNGRKPLSFRREARTPRVSIGLPVYNGARYLQDAIETLLAQSYEDFELVISDNGSTDETEEICRRYAARDPRVRYYRESVNRGAAWNYRRTFELGRGDYFRWTAHDDTCSPGHLHACVDALDAGPGVVLAFTRSSYIDEAGNPAGVEEMETFDTRGLPPHARLRSLARHLQHASLLSGLIRREALAKTGLIRPYVASDYLLCSELALLGEFQELPQQLFQKRIHPGNSLRANVTQVDAARWFDSANRQRFHFAYLRLLTGHLVVIAKARLDLPEKLRSLWVVPGYWLPRYWRFIAKELLAPFSPRFSSYQSWRPSSHQGSTAVHKSAIR